MLTNRDHMCVYCIVCVCVCVCMCMCVHTCMTVCVNMYSDLFCMESPQENAAGVPCEKPAQKEEQDTVQVCY